MINLQINNTIELFYDLLNITTWFEFYTKLFTVTYVLLAAYILSEFVGKSYNLINKKKSKRVYFSIYVIVFFILYVQTLMLLTSPINEHSDKAVLVLFIYTTALMILFLIFLALTASETYQDIRENTIGEDSKNTKYATSVYFTILTICYFKLFFIDISLSLYVTINDKFWIKDSLNSANIQKKLTSGLISMQTETNSSLDRSFFYGKNPEEIFEFVQSNANVWAIKRQPNFLMHGTGHNIDSIFTSLRVEMVQTYVEYWLSGLLQALGLLFIISSMVV